MTKRDTLLHTPPGTGPARREHPPRQNTSPEPWTQNVGQVAIPEGSSGVFSVGSVFSLIRAGFSPRLSGENRLAPLYI